MFEGRNILVYDIETDSLKTDEAKVKWFGAYSYLTKQYYLIEYKGNEKEIRKLIHDHKYLIGFNNKEFDNPIIQNNLNSDEVFNYKVVIDLLEISAPRVGKEYGASRKNRLAQMGIKLKNFTLKNIIEILKLDKEIGTKGDIDYHIFQKDEWTPEEIAEIKKYLQQDIDLTKLLFEWYEDQFSPLKKFLPEKDQENFLYIKSSLSGLAYNIICHKAGLPVEYGEKTKSQSYSGGHHIEHRGPDIIRGNIIEVDFTSAYPHAIMMGNLHSLVQELALKDIFLERLKAKKAKDEAKNKSYKIIINAHYGTSGNPVFKSIYNRKTASDCTSMVRTWLKKLAKILEEGGFHCLYGFTDSIYILIPSHLNKNHLMYYVNKFIEDVKHNVPFPMDTFNMEIEEELKMIWFVAKNCYLFVTNKNEVKYKSTLLNTNTPKAVMKLFDEYMKPIIIQQLDIPFIKKELENQLKIIIEKDLTLAAEEFKVNELSEYKVKTSLQYQISKAYGPGRHFLIPNRAGYGIGSGKHTKKGRALRHCTIEEFNKNKLTINDIELKQLLSHLKPFYERNEIKENEKEKQLQLEVM